jgi:hypothetical protein
VLLELVPNSGLLPLALQMSRTEVLSALGPTCVVDRHRIAGEDAIRSADASVRVVFRQDRVVEISASPPSVVSYGPQSIFDDASTWKALVELEPEPREVFGGVVLKTLGIAFTGLHDGDESQLSITAFERGRFDELDAEMKPFMR